MTAIQVQGTTAAPAAAPWQELLELSPLGVLVHEQQGRIVYSNPAFARLLNYSPAEAHSLSVHDLVPPTDRDDLMARLTGSEPDEAVADRRLLDREGHTIWVRVIKSAVTVGDERLFLVCVTDVGAWHDRVDRLQYAATHDELTGVLNRSGLLASVADLMSRGRAGRLALLDLDGLKTINDFYGHAAGDQVIRVTAAYLAAEGAGDWQVGRLGGDEFAIVSPHADVELRSRIEAALGPRITVAPGVSFAVSASVGEAVLRPGQDVAAALRAADEKMYLHKRDGAPRPAVLPHQGTAGRSRLRGRKLTPPPLGA